MATGRCLGFALIAMVLVAGAHLALSRTPPADDGKPRILCIGAHPDDAESGAAGTAALWVAKGYHVKFVSMTNGDIGHWRDSGPELARRRKAEVAHGAKLVGYDFEILDNRRRAPADPREPQDDHPLDPGVESRRDLHPSSQRLSSRPPLYEHSRPGLGLYGHGAEVPAPGFPPSRPIRCSSISPTASRDPIRSSPTSPSASTR